MKLMKFIMVTAFIFFSLGEAFAQKSRSERYIRKRVSYVIHGTICKSRLGTDYRYEGGGEVVEEQVCPEFYTCRPAKANEESAVECVCGANRESNEEGVDFITDTTDTKTTDSTTVGGATTGADGATTGTDGATTGTDGTTDGTLPSNRIFYYSNILRTQFFERAVEFEGEDEDYSAREAAKAICYYQLNQSIDEYREKISETGEELEPLILKSSCSEPSVCYSWKDVNNNKTEDPGERLN